MKTTDVSLWTVHGIIYLGAVIFLILQRKQKIRFPMKISHKQWRYFYLFLFSGNTAGLFLADGKTGIQISFAALAGAIALLFLEEQKRREKDKKKEEQLLRDYPYFIMKFVLLLQAGLSSRGAFYRMAADYKDSGDKHAAYNFLLTACHEMEAGLSETEAYRRFGERCGQLRYKTFVILLVQNRKSGGHYLLDQLERESIAAWEERKRMSRIEGEKLETKLLLPMGLMLVVVLAVIMIPAFMNF